MKRLNREEMARWLAEARAGAPVYLVGIGGCGMSGLAHLLLDAGFAVSGSDLRENNEVRQLRVRGVEIFIGHAPEQLQNARPELVVYSSAIRTNNPELSMAEALGAPVARRAVLLAALAYRRRSVCIAGMHGKTTTTALLAHALEVIGATPGYAVGALAPQLGRHARGGKPEDGDSFFVVETDESDGTLREFYPHQSIVLNIDEEHLDFYSNFKAVCDEFSTFAVQTSGTLFYCADDPRLVELYGDQPEAITFGFDPSANYRVQIQPDHSFIVWQGETKLGEFTIRLFGEKNVSNAVAAIAFLHHNGFAAKEIIRAVAGFRGVERRQQEIFRDDRFRIFDDYGHHPREITATCRAIKGYCGGRLLVAFQPHRYSRTQHLLSEFAESFGDADLLWITEVYAASESPIAEVNGQRLATAIHTQGQPAVYAATLEVLRGMVHEALRPGDVVLFLGAGDITGAAHQVGEDLKLFKNERANTFQNSACSVE
jgi:UDP-N-acetylmuramate--L-alanine ligase